MPVPRNRSGGFTPKSGSASSLFKASSSSSSSSSSPSLSSRLSWNDLAPALSVALLLVAGMLLAVTYIRVSSMRCNAVQLEQYVRLKGGSREERQNLVERQNDIGKRTAEALREAVQLVPGWQATAVQKKPSSSLPPASAAAGGLAAVKHAFKQIVLSRIERAIARQKEHLQIRGVIKKAAQRAGKWSAAMGTKSCPPCPDCSQLQQQQQQGQQEGGVVDLDLHFPSSSASLPSALRVVGPLCTASGFVDCGCPYGESGRVEFSTGLPGQQEEEGEGEKKPLCVDGSSPGRWTGFSQWEADNCQYRDIPLPHLHQCLNNKWVHFFGDHTSRHLALYFARLLGLQKQGEGEDDGEEGDGPFGGEMVRRRRLALESNGEREGGEGGLEEWRTHVRRSSSSATTTIATASSSSTNISSSGRRVLAATELGGSGRGEGGPRVTYLFRGKMARQRHPEPGTPEQRDLNDQFLMNMTRKGGRPDFIVMNVGVHEVMGWGKRPAPDLSFDSFREDTEKLLDLLKRTYGGGSVVWWKGNYIWPGAVLMEEYFQVQQFHELYQAHAYRRFQEAGHVVADFYQTTRDRPELVASQDGTRYSVEVMVLHAKIIANILCNHK
ncbi:hypothetical protein CLOP_g7782 [Closterium sp. NIES-67]|nr:hypothetical protein CLOP_g7782 [Closterium sp. NIES-67]